MTRRGVLEIIVVCFGLWCVVAFIGQLPTIVLYLFTPDRFDVSGISKSLFRVLRLLSPAITLIVGILFLVRTGSIVRYMESRIPSGNQASSVVSTTGRMSFGLRSLDYSTWFHRQQHCFL